MRYTVPAIAALLAVAPRVAHAQADAEYLFAPGVVSLSLFGGGIAFSDFRREAEPIASDQPLERRLSARTSVLGAGALTYWLSSRWGIRLHASYAPSRFELKTADSGTLREDVRTDAAPPLSRVDVWMYDADVVFRIPLGVGRVEPYGILGAGAVDYRLRTAEGEMVPESVAIAFEGNRQRMLAGVIGLGALVPLERHRLLLNFELTNHLGQTPLNEDALSTVAFDPESEQRVDNVGYTSNVRLMLGLTIPLFSR
ncbi:MAG: hypothetical protein ACREKM_13020 [Longimicrobiales bacterium]